MRGKKTRFGSGNNGMIGGILTGPRPPPGLADGLRCMFNDSGMRRGLSIVSAAYAGQFLLISRGIGEIAAGSKHLPERRPQRHAFIALPFPRRVSELVLLIGLAGNWLHGFMAERTLRAIVISHLLILPGCIDYSEQYGTPGVRLTP